MEVLRFQREDANTESKVCRREPAVLLVPGNLDLEGDLKCPAESAGFSSTINMKGLLQLIEVEFLSQTAVVKALALCDSACSHSWTTRSLADRLNLRGQKLNVTVNGINSRQTLETEIVKLKFRSLEQQPEDFEFTPYLRESINVGTDNVHVESLKRSYPHLGPIKSTRYRYSDVEVILGQDVYQAIRPLEYLQADSQVAPSRSAYRWVGF